VRHHMGRFVAALAVAASVLAFSAGTAAAEGNPSPSSGPPGCCV
jgi:hypothetical protein